MIPYPQLKDGEGLTKLRQLSSLKLPTGEKVKIGVWFYEKAPFDRLEVAKTLLEHGASFVNTDLPKAFPNPVPKRFSKEEDLVATAPNTCASLGTRTSSAGVGARSFGRGMTVLLFLAILWTLFGEVFSM